MIPTRHFSKPLAAVRRAWWLYALIVVVLGIFGVRAFYLQVIRHDYYLQAAMSDQLKEYEIPAARGTIKAHEGSRIVPIVLNEKRYTLYGDPALIKDASRVAVDVATIIGGNASEYEDLLTTADTRYVVLERGISDDQKKSLLKHKHPGLGAQEQQYRIYPNAALAAQVLGFVNNEGQGVYGVEQSLNEQLSGRPGLLKAVTDVHGVPLAANPENTRVAPQSGQDIVLTLDIAMQKRLENTLQQKLKDARSDSGSALIMDPNTGAIKAMANWPSYDPAHFSKVEDAALFNNPAVSAPLEIGSIMKPLTVAAALDQGVVNPNTGWYDPGEWKIDGYGIRNVEEVGGPAPRNIQDILSLSMNTGVTWLLMQMGGRGDQVTKQARERWHTYMSEHFRLGKPTGIEQGAEGEGYIPDPNTGYGLDLTYANTSFGQGMTATLLQMSAAFSAVINGGTYYQPHLVDQTIQGSKTTKNEPNVLRKNVVSSEVSQNMRTLMETAVQQRSSISSHFKHDVYAVGGKTGTAEVANPDGGYFTDQFHGTFIGYVGGDLPEYVVVVWVNKPRIGGYAGTTAAQPIFIELANMLINDFGVAPKGR